MRIIVALFLLSLAMADSCGGNCPSGNCKNCFCGAGKNMVDISAWCAKYSWNQSCCKCIVSHESAGNAHATTLNENGSSNVGLWQVNTVNWNACSGGSAPCDPNTNLACAVKVYQNGGNTWKAW